MILRQVIYDDLGGRSYLIGDKDAGIAVVDPKLDIEEYLALGHYTGVRIEHVVETHNQDRPAASRAQLAMAATNHAQASMPTSRWRCSFRA